MSHILSTSIRNGIISVENKSTSKDEKDIAKKEHVKKPIIKPKATKSKELKKTKVQNNVINRDESSIASGKSVENPIKKRTNSKTIEVVTFLGSRRWILVGGWEGSQR